MNKIGREHFYLVVLPPLIIVELILFFLNVELIIISSFLITYSWRSIMAHPSFENDIEKRTRYSIISLAYQYEHFFSNLLDKIKIPRFISCHIVVVLPVAILALISFSWFFISAIVGTLFFDLVFFGHKLILNKLVTKQ